MDLDELVRDTLPVNQPYDGLVAEAYDVWLPPGGRYGADLDANYEWRIRRCGTRARDRMTFMVHEAFRYDTNAQVQHVLNRHEIWDAGGTLVTTFLRRTQVRWWTHPQMEALLRDCDFVDVQTKGGDDGFVTVGHAP